MLLLATGMGLYGVAREFGETRATARVLIESAINSLGALSKEEAIRLWRERQQS